MRWTFLLFLLTFPVCTGCDKGVKMENAGFKVREARAPEARQEEGAKKFEEKERGGQDAPGLPPPKGEEPVEKKQKPRKIRYTADLRVVVKDFDTAWAGLKAAMKEAKTDPASEEINTSPGSPRSGTWRIRVPVDLLDTFREAVIKLGDVERNTLQSEDMTAQYYDLEAHIANRNVEQEALRDLLKEVGKKDLKHYIEVKRELDSITDDIDRKAGQLRLWKNMTDLTTVTVHLHELQKYIPEEKAKDRELPTFGMRASKTWESSWEAFLDFCQLVVIVAIAVTPWLPIPLVFFGCIWLLARRLARSPKPVRKEVPIVLEVVEEKKET